MKDVTADYSKYPKQRMKMIWTLPLLFIGQEHILIKEEEDPSVIVRTFMPWNKPWLLTIGVD